MSKRLAGKLSEDAEEEMREDVGKQQAAASPKACDPTVRDVQSTSIASSNLDTACMYHLILNTSKQFIHLAQRPSCHYKLPSSLNRYTT